MNFYEILPWIGNNMHHPLVHLTQWVQPTWPLLLKIKKGDEILKIFISETTGPIGTKLCLDSPWMIPFQNCVRQPDLQPTWPPLLNIEKGGMKFNLFSL